ncbi:MAG: metallophosphoesterase [Limisphaerales bacterium]
MRLQILSDLHLEFAPFHLPGVASDVLVLAGDVGVGEAGLKWVLETCRETPVIYVLGNHEFYHHTIPSVTRELKEMADGTNVHVLENDRVQIGEVTFLGATLWTDFALLGNPLQAEIDAEIGLNDFRHIRVHPKYARFQPLDARRFHLESVRWLREQFRDLAGRKSVVVTHHAPSGRSIRPEHRDDPLNPAFASNLEPLIAASGARLWVHGHLHSPADYKVGSTRVLNNPRGYPMEQVAGFEAALVVEV